MVTLPLIPPRANPRCDDAPAEIEPSGHDLADVAWWALQNTSHHDPDHPCFDLRVWTVSPLDRFLDEAGASYIDAGQEPPYELADAFTDLDPEDAYYDALADEARTLDRIARGLLL